MMHSAERCSLVRRLGAAVAATALLGLAAGCGGAAEAGVPVPPQSLGQVIDAPLPASIANLPLTLPSGKQTTLAAFKGKAVMIADSMTLCTDICPMITANVVQLARTLQAEGWGNKAALIEITVDPWRDSPARLRAYEKLYGGPLPDWFQLTGSPATIAKLWKYFAVDYGRQPEGKPADIDWWTHKKLTFDVFHSDDLFFLDPQGHQRFITQADPDVGGKLPPSRLVKTLSDEGRNALYHPDPVGAWTVPQGLSVFSWLTNHRFPAPA